MIHLRQHNDPVANVKVSSRAGCLFKKCNFFAVADKSAGTSRDWAKGVPRIRYVYTVELRDTGHLGFLLPPNQILPTGTETWAAIKAMMRAIEKEEGGTQHQRYGYRGRQSDRG